MKSLAAFRTLALTAGLLAPTSVALAADPPVPLVQQAFPDVPASWFHSGPMKAFEAFTLESARTGGDPNSIEVTFSAPVLPATLTDPAHYIVDPGVNVTAARPGPTAFSVVLTTSAIPDAGLHTLTVTGLTDTALPPNTLPADSTVPVIKAQGVITRKLFTVIPGAAVSDLTSAAKFPAAPDAVDFPAAFEATANAADNYGLQFAGCVHPPATGDYAFFIAADEQAALYLSPDANPAGKALIASVPSATAARAYTTLTSQRSAYVRLEAGRAYYLEALLKEAGGSDHLAVTWRLRGMPAPATGDSPIPGTFLSSLTPSAPVGVVAQPQPQTVAERAAATFTVTPTGTPPYTYQWRKNGTPIPGATASSYSITSVPYSFDGLAFSVMVGNSFSSAVSDNAVLTVSPDTSPPTIASLAGSATLDRVFVTFSEPVTAATANNPANYTFTGGLSVLEARLQPNGISVVLLTGPQTPGTAYTLTATGVADTFARHNSAPTSAAFTAWVSSRGFLRREVFSGIGGATVADLTNHARFPDSPDQSGFLTAFECPGNVADNYGQRVFGWLLPPATGFYRFFLSSDDDSVLFLSSDDTPANAATIATLTTDTASSRDWAAAAQSVPLWLEAGHSYYVEAQMKESAGNDHLAVAWQVPGGLAPATGAAPIDGQYLATSANPLGASLVIAQQPASVTVPESSATTLSVGVTASSMPVFYQWQRNGADIPGANSASYTTPRLFRGDDGARFRCFVSIPGANQLSDEAIVAVTPDNAPPLAVSAATLTGSATVGLCFNELLDPETAANPANYTLSTGGGVLAATLRPDGQSVALTLATLFFTNSTVTVHGVKDLAGNAVSANSAVAVVVSGMEAADVGTPGVDPLERGSTFTCRTGDYDVVAGGSDIYYNNDGFHFTYEQRTGDFDVKVRIVRLDYKAYPTFAGIHVRENLTPGSRNMKAHLFSTNGANGYHMSYRAQQDGTSASPIGLQSGPVPFPNAWIRLTRANDTFTAWHGTDGVNWTPFGEITMTFTGPVYVGLIACAANNNIGQATTAWFRDYSATGTVVPPTPFDLLIKKAAEPASSFSLDNIYQTTPHGAQDLWQTATSTVPATFDVQIQNDGTNSLSPVVKATETAETGWTVTYRADGQDITAQVRSSSGYTVANLASGTPETITLEFLPGRYVLGGTPKSATLSVFSDPFTTSLRDTVRATAISEPSHQPDLMVRRLTDVIYRGKGVFNADGTGQSKTLELDYGMTGVYPIQLFNAGNLTNFFTLRGPAGGPGWSVRYFDAVSAGAEITGDMTAGGTIVALPPNASWEGRVEVTFDVTVPRGTAKELLVIATNDEDTGSDTVKIVTTVMTTSDVPLAGIYTTDEDFERGMLAGLIYVNDQLQLSSESSVLPFIWVPNSNEGSVSKVDTRTGREIARYRTCPTGVNGQPSRTTIDQFGNCWVANRQSGTVVKIGLLESGQYLDRNGNGVVDTSADLNNDGDITGAEMLPWGQDECVPYEVILIPGKEGTYTPGTYTGGYVDNYWNPGPRGIAVDFSGSVWAGTHDAMKYYYLEGSSAAILRTLDTSAFGHTPYGAVIDGNGILWSSGYRESGQNSVLRLDPKDNSMSAINFEFHTYGLGLDRNDHLFVSGHQEGKLSRINVLTGTREWTVNAGYLSRGVTSTDDGDVWVACSSEGTVWRFSNDGTYKSKLSIGNTPTGVSVDSAGKVWVVNDGDENINRIDPTIGATGSIDLTKRIIGGLHYGYSDMTGIIARSATTRFGTWTVIHNSKAEYTPWNSLTWHGSNVSVRVRSSHDRQQWSAWERAENGYPLAATPAGQYLEIEVTLQQLAPADSPVLYDLTVNPVPQGVADLEITHAWSAAYAYAGWPLTNRITVTNHGPDDASGIVLTSSLPAGTTFVSASSSQGSYALSNGQVRWFLGSLANGASMQAEVVVMVANPGTFTNVVAVHAYDTDPQAGNSQGTRVVPVVPALQGPGAPPMEGLLGWWPGDENANDLRGTHHGVLMNGATLVPGKVRECFSFDGVNDYLDLGNWFDLQVYTIAMWVKPGASQNVHADMIDNNHTESRSWVVQYQNTSSGNATYWLSGINSSAGDAFVNFWLTNDIWQLLVITLDSDRIQRLYVDGSIVGTATLGGPVYYDGTQHLDIGSHRSLGRHFNGQIDEIRIFGRALTDSEVAGLYQAGGNGMSNGDVRLAVDLVPSGVLLSWPASAAGWLLEGADTLEAGTVWQPEATPPQFTDSVYQVTLPLTGVRRFYRLKGP
ncbi:MAG: hypothetical protein NTW21_39480 [Verrucomicrobia bacterium]|nr:hypothetical protein [Verrucomicrobiota bacterium]